MKVRPLSDKVLVQRLEAEMKGKKACYTCLAGGVPMLRALSALDKIKVNGDEKIGVDMVRRAVVWPIKQIAVNAGLDDSVVTQKVVENGDRNFGYDALRKKYGDLIKFGVLVPTKVERIALQNSASIAPLLLMTDAVVSEIPEKRKKTPSVPEEDEY